MTGKTILVVEDDKDLLFALSVRLASGGYNILRAPDATTAILKAAQDKPDLILLDLGLPDGNGFVVMDIVKQLSSGANIPVIVISARPQDVYKEAAILAGAKDYFQKPYRNDELMRAIERALAAALPNGTTQSPN